MTAGCDGCDILHVCRKWRMNEAYSFYCKIHVVFQNQKKIYFSMLVIHLNRQTLIKKILQILVFKMIFLVKFGSIDPIAIPWQTLHPLCLLWPYNCAIGPMRGTSQSAPEYSLSLRKKNSHQILTPQILVQKKRFDHSFQNCLDTWCQNCMAW